MMKKVGPKIAGMVVLVLTVVIVIGLFWPAVNRPTAQQPEGNQAVGAVESALPETIEQNEPDAYAERLYQLAVQQTDDPNISAEPDYRIVIACCREILREHPDSPQAEKAQALLQKVPEQYQREYEREMMLAYPRPPKVKKSRSLRRRVPARYYQRPEIPSE